MTHDNDVLWTLHVNYHHVRTSQSEPMIDQYGSSNVAINSNFCVWLYQVGRTVGSASDSVSTALESMTHIGKTNPKIHKNAHYSAYPLEKNTLLRCLQNVQPNGNHSGEYVDLVEDYFKLFHDQKIVCENMAKKFVKRFKLKDKYGEKLTMDEDMHNNYRQIFASFQDKYGIQMAFVEGSHRSVAMFLTGFNIQNKKDGKSNIHHVKSEPFNFVRSVIDAFAPISILTNGLPIYDWEIVNQHVEHISASFLKRRETYIEMSLANSFSHCLDIYGNQDDLVMTLSNEFLHKSHQDKQSCDFGSRWRSYCQLWAEELLGYGWFKSSFISSSNVPCGKQQEKLKQKFLSEVRNYTKKYYVFKILVQKLNVGFMHGCIIPL